MSESNKYLREYFILENLYNAATHKNDAAGYIKIEIKNNNARLFSVIQNLKKENKDSDAVLYVIKNKSIFHFARIGRYEYKNNNFEIAALFDSRNILESKLNYNEVSMFVVVEENSKGEICSRKNCLIALREQKTEVNNVIEKLIAQQKSSKISQNIENSNNINNNEIRKHNEQKQIYKEDMKTEQFQQKVPGIKQTVVNYSAKSEIPQTEENEHPDFLSVSEVAWDIDRLIDCCNKFFEKTEPFGVSRKDYSWWKVNSTVNLNNILFQCNIKTPILFNPLVMVAHYKYKHLIVGVYCDKARKKEFLVFGIPGYYNVDERPFGEMCLWVGTNTLKLQENNFGYWLVYIEPKSGKFVSFG